MRRRYLANALVRMERKKDAKTSQRWMSLLTLGLITGLVLLFINNVVLCPVLPRNGAGADLWAWVVTLSAGGGLVFMYRTAFNDPGVLLVGLEGKGKGRSPGSGASRVDLPVRPAHSVPCCTPWLRQRTEMRCLVPPDRRSGLGTGAHCVFPARLCAR